MSGTALIAVEKASPSFDRLFGYRIPDGLAIKPGQRVIVPFGAANKNRVGVVFSVDEKDGGEKLKSIVCAAEEEAALAPEMLALAEYMKEKTLCTYFDAVRTMLPPGLAVYLDRRFSYNISRARLCMADGSLSDEEKELVGKIELCGSKNELSELLRAPENAGAARSLMNKGIVALDEDIKRKVSDSTERSVTLGTALDELPEDLRLSPKQKAVAQTLSELGTVSVKEICYLCCVSEAVIKNLEKKGVVEIFDTEVSRALSKDARITASLSDIVFSPLQQKTYDGILELMNAPEPKCALLHGVTGSGKTSVFIKLIEQCEKDGRTAILLVPEIALTPQTVGKFQSLFGNTVAIIHSNLSLGQRADEYKRIKNGEAHIVIGTRSAIFAPLDNIGLIVIDEEDEHTYKSDRAPRYHARDIAKQRCFKHNALLLLASATPSFDSYHNALAGRYSLFEMNERYSKNPLPEVVMIDMGVEAQRGSRGNFSQRLIDEISLNLDRGEQSMLLLNRRGYNTYASCVNCGAVVACPNCSGPDRPFPLTYHKINDSVICHYCGYRKPMPRVCEKCGSKYIYATGTGTQRIESEIKELFPAARVLRMDADTTMSRYSYEKRFAQFKNREYDIMVGTQMIAKGLDFENVTLVGVLLIDKSLYAGDYLGYEKTFSLITQVVGRCGRGEKPGRAFMQTYSPDHYVLELAARQDYKSFYEQESEVRHALIFPPYCDICLAAFIGREDGQVMAAAAFFADAVKEAVLAAEKKLPLVTLGPTSCGRISQSARAKVIFKCRNTRAFRDVLRAASEKAYKAAAFKGVSFYIDFNGEII